VTGIGYYLSAGHENSALLAFALHSRARNGEQATLLRELFSQGKTLPNSVEGAQLLLDNIENIKIPAGLSRQTLEAYRVLISRVGDPVGTQAIRAKVLDILLK